MTGPDKSSSSSSARKPLHSSIHVNTHNDEPHQDRVSGEVPAIENGNRPTDNKENVTPNKKEDAAVLSGGDKENPAPAITNGSSAVPKPAASHHKRFSSGKKVLKPSSLEFCMQMTEPDSAFWSKFRDPIGSENSNSANIWDFSDSEAAPASSWSTLPNRTLLCRPLPMDIGRCTCLIVKEPSPQGVNGGGGTLYSLYTNEGKGRQDRKLAVALCKRRSGKSIFTVAQSIKGVLSNADDSYIGAVTANLMGSKYHIWDQGICVNSVAKQSKTLLAVVKFLPTIATWTGSYRAMRAYIPKHQSMLLKNTTHVQHINGLPVGWEERVDRVHQLVSAMPQYNKVSH
ncbi:hypothetical protein SAY87_014882 [Trapa incisa]|uniref:Tubby C-terminal domain-containing protein n=1 Tax=Trapa incisa TaxID=236973 RepID=A0AAN7JDN5_9MYRT|nr:hypothetical protein SAY87_014882 [Trapa incisa]